MSPRRSPAVEALLQDADSARRPTVQALRDLVLNVDPRIREDVKWNSPSYFLDDGSCFATQNLRARSGVLLVLHFDAGGRRDRRPDIVDPQGLLDWKSAERATLAVPAPDWLEQNASEIRAILSQWIAQVG